MATSYQPLALKYRPRRFEQVIGQDGAVAILKGMVTTGKVHNLIVLHGPTGCGKTTLARLLGRYTNCSHKRGVDHCEGCDSCQAFKAGHHPDIHETDGGIFTGIDDVRSLQRSITFHPRYQHKIHILDEVHALSPQAWTAALKMFEEPPPGVTFALCTTDVTKIPEAIMGRSSKIALAPVRDKELAHLVRKVAKHEGVKHFPADAADKIVACSQGHVRNALNALEQVLLALASGEAIDIEAQAGKVVESVLGMTPWQTIDLYLQTILKGAAPQAVRLVQEIGLQEQQHRTKQKDERTPRDKQPQRVDPYVFLEQIGDVLASLINHQLTPELVDPRHQSRVQSMVKVAKDWTLDDLTELYLLFARAHGQLRGHLMSEFRILTTVTYEALRMRRHLTSSKER